MKIIPTVHELRKRGYQVSVNHHRQFFKYDSFTGKKTVIEASWYAKNDDYPDYFLSPYGGRTVIAITEKGGAIFEGIAYCSVVDKYVKKEGVKRAIAKAYAKLCKFKNIEP